MVYLDYNATTPLRPEVFEAMKPQSAAARQMIGFSLGVETLKAYEE